MRSASSTGVAPRRSRSARVPLDQLHDQKMPAAGLLHPVERRNVRMIERGEHFRFALESRDAIRIERERLGQDLHRHRAPELRILRTIDLAHPTRAEQAFNPIVRERGTDH